MNITNTFSLIAQRATFGLLAIAFVFGLAPQSAFAIDNAVVTISDVAITYGDDAGFTAHLSNGFSDVGGANINFYVDGNLIGNSATDGNGNATITVQDPNAGSYVVTAEFAGGFVGMIEYVSDTDTADLDVAQLMLTITGLSADDKTYDGNDNAVVTGSAVLNGVLPADVADVSLIGTVSGDFDDETADTGKTVTFSGLSLDGAKASNYDFVDPTDLADIDPLDVTVTIDADNKVYDSLTGADVTYDVVGAVGGDDVEASGTATFDTKDVGTDKLVTALGIALSGADDGNYNLMNVSATTTADITPAPLSATVTVSDKTYDDTDAATILTITPNGLVGGEVVTINGGVAVFDDQHAGLKNVDIASLNLVADAVSANYDFDDTATASATINQVALTVTANTDTKVFDGSNSSAVLPTITSGALVGNDTAGYVQTYDTANAGTAKTITPSGAANDGNGGLNYAVTFVPNVTGVITKAPLTITADDLEKVYGSANPLATATYDGFVGGDDENDLDTPVTLVIVANNFSDVDNHVITAFGAADANYVITHVNGNLVVTPFELTANASATDKVYDGNTDADASVTPVGMLFGDTVTASHTSASFDTADVGASKDVTLSGVTLGGVDAGNYSIAGTAMTTANITQLAIEVTADAGTKVYGDSDPALTYTTDIPLVGGDSFSGSLDRDSGEDVGDYAITEGTLDAGPNYAQTFVGNTFSITPAELVITANDETKAYLEALPPFSVTYDGFENGDDEADLDTPVSIGTTADEFSNTGTYPITPSGALGSNYTISFEEGTLTIVQADQEIDFDGLDDKDYGDADFVVSATAESGLAVTFLASGACEVTGDVVHLTTKGVCTITAQQAGDSNWNPAPDVDQSFDVYDVTAPVISLTDGLFMDLQTVDGGTFPEPGYSATDDTDAVVTVVVTGTVDMETPGVYELFYDAEDESGNVATTVVRTVTIVAPSSGGGGGSRRVETSGEVLGASSFQFTRELGLGSTGLDVTELQKLLTSLGFYNGPITGYFGPLTQAGVRAFQASKGINQTGYVGPLTLAALNALDAPAGPTLAELEAQLKALQEELAKMMGN